MLTVEENESLHVQVARLRRENAALKDALDISMNVNARDPEHTYRQLVESEARPPVAVAPDTLSELESHCQRTQGSAGSATRRGGRRHASAHTGIGRRL